MLRIHTATSPEAVKKYFSASDYYSEGQETIGRWIGKFAARLGLRGEVDQQSFERLCDNLHPVTGERLTLRTNDNRRVGYDMVFDAGAKSFSVLVAMAPEEERRRLMQAFDASVRETVERDVEPDMHCRVRKDGAFCDRRTGNIAAAWFGHTTSRPVGDNPPDPHIHAHVFVFNATEDPDEQQIKAGEFSYIKRDGEYYNALMMSRLTKKLEAMGYAIDRRGGKAWEIAGIPQSVIDKFSKRKEEIEAEHQHRLLSDPDYRPENKHELGARTRQNNQEELSPGELRQAWDGQLTRAERAALEAVYRKGGAGSETVTARQAVDFALRHCFVKESLVPERVVVATALLRGLGHVAAGEVRSEMDRQGVLTGEIDGRFMATTREVQRQEEYLVTWAAQGRSTVPPVGVRPGLARGKLDDEQWAAVCGLLGTSDRVAMVDSAADTGKSTLLSAYDRSMKLVGENVTYLGTTATSVKVLKKDGLSADTLARFLVDERMQKAAEGGRVVVDEVSMLGHQDAYTLFKLAEERDLSLVFLGDSRQHASVARGAFMRILQEYGGIQPFRLTGIKRQQDAEYLAAVQELSQGKPVEGFDRLKAKGWVMEMGHQEDRGRHIAADYLRAMEDLKAIPENDRVLVVSPTHAEAAHITREIRSQLRQAGKLGKEDRDFTRLVAVDASEAERGLATTYRAGDVIQFHQNAKGHAKGERITVTDPADVPVALADRFSLYRPEAIALTQGDIIRFTATVTTRDGEHKLRNGDVHSVKEITPGGNIRLDNGWVVEADAGHFRHGYVETSFGAQGRTVHRVLLGMSSDSLPATNMEQIYVSASRALERLWLYTDDSDGVRDAIRRSSLKRAALDLVPPVPQAKPEEERPDRLRQHMDRRKRWANAQRRRAVPEAPRLPERKTASAHRPGSGASWSAGMGNSGRLHTQTERLTPHQRGREDDRGR
jgi:conjugative relaxase-like TrwC/TraI family protein